MDPRNSEKPPMAHPQEPSRNIGSERAPVKTQAHQPLSRRIRGVLGQLRETLVPIYKKIPPEEITLQKTADVISKYVSHPSNERRGFRPEEIPFDITDMLVQMGYESTLWQTGDFMEKHPQAYTIVRRRLLEASQMGSVRMEELPASTSHGETIIYHVSNLEILRKIASGEIKPPSDITGSDVPGISRKP